MRWADDFFLRSSKILRQNLLLCKHKRQWSASLLTSITLVLLNSVRFQLKTFTSRCCDLIAHGVFILSENKWNQGLRKIIFHFWFYDTATMHTHTLHSWAIAWRNNSNKYSTPISVAFQDNVHFSRTYLFYKFNLFYMYTFFWCSNTFKATEMHICQRKCVAFPTVSFVMLFCLPFRCAIPLRAFVSDACTC